MSTQRHQVIVVGGGLAGASLALGLIQRGIDAIVVEPRPPRETRPAEVDPRVYAMSPASVALFRQLGLWPAIEAGQRCCPYQRMRVWADDPAQALSFASTQIGEARLGWIIEQAVMLAALWSALPPARRRIADGGVCRLKWLTEGDAPSRLRLGLDSGRELEAPLVIAADGVASPLRQMAGIACRGRRYHEHAVICHLQSSRPHHGEALQRFLPGGPIALLPLADGRRSLVWSMPSDAHAAALQLAPEALAAQVETQFQGQAGELSACTTAQAFELRLQTAEAYQRDGLLLIGDAAHRVHPLAGQGANLGLGDVAALLAAFDAAGRGLPTRSQLRAWERQRQAAAAEMIVVTDGLDRMFSGGNALMRSVGGQAMGWLGRVPVARNALIRRAVAF